MLIILFRSRLTDAAGDDYAEMAQEMETLARSSPGFIDMKAFRAEDGERLMVIWWNDEATLKNWRENVRHRMAQKLGREKWYRYYKLEVASVVRGSDFDRMRAAGGS